MTATDTAAGMPTPSSRPSDAGDRGGRRRTAVLVTGAAGEVGHALVAALAGSGRHDVVAIDVRELAPETRELCRDTHVGDVCDRALLGRLLAMYEICEIFHLAALLSTRAEFTPETAHEVNVGGTINLLRLAAEQARSHGLPVKFILPSSIAVHGLSSLEEKARAGAVKEDEHCQPTTMYGCNKLYCEHLGRYYAHYYRQLAQDRIADALDFRCIRYPGLISADTLPSGGTSDFAPEMIHAAADHKPYACFVRPEARIPFMTMPEAVDATLRLASADASRLTRNVYAVSSFSASAGEMAALTRRFFPDAEITFEPDVQRQAIVDSWPEDTAIDAAVRDWDFAPTYTMEQAFESYLVPAIRRRYA